VTGNSVHQEPGDVRHIAALGLTNDHCWVLSTYM
jgi:hypothetical protein